MRPEIALLIAHGPLPAEESASVQAIEEIESLLKSVTRPVTNEEAIALVRLFGNDNCFGLAWTLLHLIESAPDWPISLCLTNSTNEWVALLRERTTRSKLT